MDDKAITVLENLIELNERDGVGGVVLEIEHAKALLKLLKPPEALNYSQVDIESFVGYNQFLSNFYPSVITTNGITYPTVEHYYQAMKTNDLTEREIIRNAKTPGAAKRLGQKCAIRSDWDDVKLQIMEYALRRKFDNGVLRQSLLDTGTRQLIEGNDWGDKYWGMCDGVGENHLGKLLMKRRELEKGFDGLLAGAF